MTEGGGGQPKCHVTFCYMSNIFLNKITPQNALKKAMFFCMMKQVTSLVRNNVTKLSHVGRKGSKISQKNVTYYLNCPLHDVVFRTFPFYAYSWAIPLSSKIDKFEILNRSKLFGIDGKNLIITFISSILLYDLCLSKI